MPPREPARILIVDDQLAMAENLADGLSDQGFEARAMASSKKAVLALEAGECDVLVTDLRMPEVDGLELLAASVKADPARPVIVMTAYGAIDTAIEAMRRGAFHYLTKPFKLDELVIVLRRALEQVALRRETETLRTELARRDAPTSIVAESRAMRQVLETVARIANADAPVLLLGETGTGKNMIARVLHERSRRAASPFVTVNCAAIPEALLESELFGHVRGAFTGASSDRPGLFVEAHQGTLFLDEIGDMPLSLQGKLLDVLERGVVRAVGGNRERAVDVRIVAATHRDLRQLAKSGGFREDLLYRLDVVSFTIPPLRARKEDLPLLIESFLRRARARHEGARAKRFSPAALHAMLEHAWPGNVRELSHSIERAVLLCDREVIDEADLAPAVRERPSGGAPFEGEVVTLREIQRRYARWALDQCGGQRMKTAERLGIDPKTLARLLQDED